MSFILFLFLFIFNRINCSEIYLQEEETFNVTPGFSKTYFLKYENSSNFIFNIPENNSIEININAYNCYFNVEFNGELLKQLNLDTYSLKISANNSIIKIKPLLDVTYGQYKENYRKKSCPISMNSYILNSEPEIKIQNKEVNYFYFETDEYDLLKISYDIKEVLKESYAGLSFLFNNKCNFLIKIFYINEKSNSTKIKRIYNSSSVFLDSSFLLYDPYEEKGGNLTIYIENLDKKSLLLRFKIIEKDSISLLQKDALNFGFVTSETVYQYFYTEVFQGEEGELVLHKKRVYGLLYGKIVDKSDVSDLNDTSIYPNEDTDNTTVLNYNYHSLQLNFSYENTTNCTEGCYLLITFKQRKPDGNYPLIGFEFTILTRFWNYTDYISNIVDVPFNEYLIGSFEKSSITHHYYSLYVPEDADKIIIQIECNYLDGFYGEGRLKINTAKKIGNTEKLDINNDQNLLTLNVKSLKLVGKFISLAFRPKDFFDDIFAFYYFRVIYLKENENIYYPVDSILGNLCLPEPNNDNNLYYCHFLFKNDFNELSRNFTISSSIQNEYYTIYAQIFKNGKMYNDSKRFVYNIINTKEEVDYYLFTFEFPNGELKNIISSISDNVTDFYPQIYSYHMLFIDKSMKINHFKMKNNYTVYYQYIYGYAGKIIISFLEYEKFYSTRNFKGKPLSVTIKSETDFIRCITENNNYAYFMKLQYNMKNKAIEEIKSGTTYSQFIIGRNFPLYYYLEIKNKNHINIDINLRINSYIDEVLRNNFEIRGYIVDKDTIQRKINGEYIQLDEPIPGYYSNTFKVGLLQINKQIENEKNHILIEIISDNKNYIDSYLLVELVTKEYTNEAYFLPINQYVIETFDDENNETRRENKYYLSSEEKMTDQALIEISSAYSDIIIKFNESSNVTYTFTYFSGFNKYRVYYANNDNVYFSVINPSLNKNANYMIRYYYTGLGSEYIYSVDDENRKINISYQDNNYANVCISYNSIKIVTGNKGEEKEVNRSDIYFYIYAFLFKKDTKSKELINTTSILHERNFSYQTKTIHYYNYSNKENWNITFENIERNKYDKYELQLQVNVYLLNNIFNEEFLIFTSELDLTEIKYSDNLYIILIIVGVVVGILIIGLVVYFVLKYKNLKKSNLDLKEDLKDMAFANDVQKDVLKQEQITSQRYTDFETTFI